MGATLRITWLQLSLSFLFLSVCSSTDNQNISTTTEANVALTNATTVTTPNDAVTTPATITTPAKTTTPATATTPAKTTTPATATTPAKTTTLAITTTTKPTDKTNTNGPTVATVTNNPQALTTSTSEVPTAAASPAAISPATAASTATVPPAATPRATTTSPAAIPPAPGASPAAISPAATASPATAASSRNTVVAPSVTAASSPATASPVATTMTIATSKAVTPAPGAGSSNESVLNSKLTTTQTTTVPTPSQATGTRAASGLPGNVGTTNITNVMTVAPMSKQQPVTHAAIAMNTSQKGVEGIEKTTTVVKGPEQTTSRAPKPSGNPVTTSISSTLNMAGTNAPPLVATTGTMPLQMSTTSSTANSSTAAQLHTFSFSLNAGQMNEGDKALVEVCKRLMFNLQDGNCTLTWKRLNDDKKQFVCVTLYGNVKTDVAAQYYEDITKKPTDNKTLIAILASCGALLIMIIILAVCASHRRKPYNDNQHLTEELHTVENGYHDNPTLEVMEVQPEMQEKKMALNGECNDSWIVPIENMLKEDIADEEDTHL